VVTVLFKISLETSTWTFWNWLAVVGSGVLWLLYVLMFGKFWPSIRVFSPEYMAGQGTQVFSSAVFWLGMFLIPFITIMRDLLYKIYRYETATENTFKRERNFDNERITFRKFFNQTKENIEHMALIRRKTASSVAASEAQSNRSPSRAHIRTGEKRQSYRGYAFNQTDEPANMQTKMIRADRTKKDQKSSSDSN
jgi:phospholipid-transporting ATPase